MPGRINIRELWAKTAQRYSQSSQYIGEVVDANTTDGTVMMRVGGRIVRCEVQTGSTIKYGEKLDVSRVPGNAMLRVNTTEVVVNRRRVTRGGAATVSQAISPPPVRIPCTPILWATAISSSEIFLEWGSTGENTTNFLLERRINGTGPFVQIVSVPVSQTVYMDTGLAEETEYCYRVRASNAGLAYSDYSNIACATTLRDWILAIMNGSQLAVTTTYGRTSPSWANATPSMPQGATLRGFVIDPDGIGAWALTGNNTNTSETTGVFRCDDIQASSPIFSLKYSQNQARIDGQAALYALGWIGVPPAEPYFNEMGSIATGANGCLVVVERKWDGFADRPPSCVFATTNSGGNFYAYVPSGSNNHRFWADQYQIMYGCHQIWWDGAQYIIGGTSGWPNFNALQATATSSDGTSWNITEVSAPGYEFPRSYSNGYSLFEFGPGGNIHRLIQLPSTVISDISPHNGIWYRHFNFGGTQCYIHEDTVYYNIQNYLNVGGVDVVDSADVYGAARIGGAALKDTAIYVLVPLNPMSTGMVVCEREGAANIDKTGDLLTVLGGSWLGGAGGIYDNCQVEIF